MFNYYYPLLALLNVIPSCLYYFIIPGTEMFTLRLKRFRITSILSKPSLLKINEGRPLIFSPTRPLNWSVNHPSTPKLNYVFPYRKIVFSFIHFSSKIKVTFLTTKCLPFLDLRSLHNLIILQTLNDSSTSKFQIFQTVHKITVKNWTCKTKTLLLFQAAYTLTNEQ